MSIASAIQNAQGKVAAAYTKCSDKGATMPQTQDLSHLADCIDSISTGGGGIAENDVNFRDYDGTIVAAYSAADFANLSALPANPTHQGLTAQGWNWSLANAKTFVAAHGGLEIGQMYVTDDGKTRLYLDLPYAGTIKIRCRLNGSGTDTSVIDWGDGSTSSVGVFAEHTYSTPGEKLITIFCDENHTVEIGVYNYGEVAANGLAKWSLYKVELGARIQSIARAFANCINLQSVTMPLGISDSHIGADGNSGHSFEYTAIRHLTVPSDITMIGETSFKMDSGRYELQSISLPKSLTIIYDKSFYRAGYIKKLYIPESVESFAKPSSTITTEASTFRGLINLQVVTIPLSLSFIPKSSFMQCCSLRDVVLNSDLTAIGESAFSGCSSLINITIPSTVNEIRTKVFENCILLKDVYLLPTTPPTLANKNAFPNNPTTLHVPHGYLETYQTASVWGDLASQMVEMPE